MTALTDKDRLKKHTLSEWSGSDTDGMLCNEDTETGGIIDSEIKSGLWFVIFNNDKIQPIYNLASRSEAVSAFIEQTSPPTRTSQETALEMALRIPEPKIPRDEKRLAYAKSQIALTRPFMLDMVYDRLKPNAIPATFVHLTHEEAISLENAVLDEHADMSDRNIDSNPHLKSVKKRLDLAIAEIGEPCFTRLNSRSPKDSWGSRYKDRRQLPSTNGYEALRCFYMSERIFTDLLDANPTNTPVSIVLRPYQTDMSADQEFRIYIEKNKSSAWRECSTAPFRRNGTSNSTMNSTSPSGRPANSRSTPCRNSKASQSTLPPAFSRTRRAC